MKNEVEVSGKTVNEAIEKGLKKLNIEKKDAEIKILDEGKSGLFGLMGSSPARIKISIKEGVQVAQKSDETAGETSIDPSRRIPSEVDESAVAKKAEEAIKKILELAGFDVKVSSEASSRGIILNISCEDSAILIGRQGQTMQALEYVLKLILSKQEGRGVRVALNIDGYLERKNEKIIKKARELEEQVKVSGEPVEIKLPASERKIIHLTLQDSEFVETASEGDGEDRKLVIRPKKA